jgi:glyoxylase-like metal-dependent hydrolase (beta-lactamase superfamily II)
MAAASAPAWSQGQPAAPARPQFATTKVDGTDNVYVFRYLNRQAMFVVTADGVIATDPIGYGYPETVPTYINEIKKVTDKPIKYLIYSHHHYDHIAGGQPFKDAGAKIVAHKRAKDRLAVLKDPATPLPDETFEKRRTITLGGTALELSYLGLNHSDSSIVMRLPKEKILFAVDFLPVGGVPGRGMIDFYPIEAEESIKQVLKMDWERMIPGHPGPGGRLGTKADAQDQLIFLQEASEAVKVAAREGKCWEPAEKELKLPKYESWPGYQNNLQFVIRRYCGLWGRGT